MKYRADRVKLLGWAAFLLALVSLFLAHVPSPRRLLAAGPKGQYLQFRTLDLQPTSQQVGTGPAQVFGWYIYNNSASTRYVKVYNQATADQTATPVMTLGLPPSSAANVSFPDGLPFLTACCLRGTQNVADNDATAPTANDLVVNVLYGNQQP